MGMGAPIGSQGGMPPQQKPGVPMPAQGKGQPGVQQPNRPVPMPPQGKGQPMPAQGKGQPMQPQGPYGQRPEDMYKGKDFNKGQGQYGQPYPGFVPGQLPQVQRLAPGQLPSYALPYAPALRSQVQPQIGAPIQGLGQVPANQGLMGLQQMLAGKQ
jgi:hypothetical protein